MFIYCNYELFDTYQTIYVVNEKGKKEKVDIAAMEMFPNAIIDACEKYKTNKIKLSGSKQFLNQVSEEILSYAKLKYSNRNYEIEVI